MTILSSADAIWVASSTTSCTESVQAGIYVFSYTVKGSVTVILAVARLGAVSTSYANGLWTVYVLLAFFNTTFIHHCALVATASVTLECGALKSTKYPVGEILQLITGEAIIIINRICKIL